VEALGIIGFIFGMAGLSIAVKARDDLVKLKQEIKDLKETLKPSSVAKDDESSK
jgi:hypothetical protein